MQQQQQEEAAARHGEEDRSSSGGAQQPSAKPHSPRRYIPLDVRTWNEASLVVLGWLLVPALAVLSGLLFFFYEVATGCCLALHACTCVHECTARLAALLTPQMLFINVQDRDLRDLYMDQRIMNTANK